MGSCDRADVTAGCLGQEHSTEGLEFDIGDVMTCEYFKGLWHVPMCDFSEAWSSEGWPGELLTELVQGLSDCPAPT